MFGRDKGPTANDHYQDGMSYLAMAGETDQDNFAATAAYAALAQAHFAAAQYIVAFEHARLATDGKHVKATLREARA